MHRRLARSIVALLVTVAAASLSTGAAHAVPWNSVDFFPPKDPVETPFCGFDYVDPNDFGRYDRSDVTVSSPSPGQVVFRFRTQSESVAPYTQKATLVWANLDSGISGVGDTTVRIDEGGTTIVLPVQTTGSGRIMAVTGVNNTSDDGQKYTSYDCSAEYTVP